MVANKENKVHTYPYGAYILGWSQMISKRKILTTHGDSILREINK